MRDREWEAGFSEDWKMKNGYKAYPLTHFLFCSIIFLSLCPYVIVSRFTFFLPRSSFLVPRSSLLVHRSSFPVFVRQLKRKDILGSALGEFVRRFPYCCGKLIKYTTVLLGKVAIRKVLSMITSCIKTNYTQSELPLND